MRFHLREALRARLPFSALSLSLSRSKPSTYSSSPLGPILCCRVSWATKRSSTPNKEEILLQIPSLVFRKLTAASPTRLGSFVVDRLLFRAEWYRNRKKTHTHTQPHELCQAAFDCTLRTCWKNPWPDWRRRLESFNQARRRR